MHAVGGSSAMSITVRRTSRRAMTPALARSSSVSLVLPLAPQNSTFVCTLRRAQSSIPAVECCVVTSDFCNNQNNNNGNGISNKRGNSQQQQQVGDQPGNHGDGDREQEIYLSDYGSCNSSIADLLDVLDEPQRLPKEILRSVSLSFQWLDVPFQEFDLPTVNREDTSVTSNTTSEQPQHWGSADSNSTADGRVETVGLPIGRQGSLRFAYIHECETGRSLVTHMELKTAMDSLQHWTMQVPRNCCLSYRHGISGEVVTLPWPDLEAGGMDEIEEFVNTVNRVEGKPVFYPRYERSAFDVRQSLCLLSPLARTATRL